MIFLYIFSAIILIVLLTSIQLTIFNVEDETDVKFKIGVIFYFHINYEKFVNFFVIYRDKEKKISLNALYRNLIMFFSERKIFKDFAKYIRITKLEIISKNNCQNPIVESYVNASSLILFSLIKEILNSNFRVLKNDSYRLSLNHANIKDTSYDFDYFISMKIRVIDVIIVFFKNFKNVIYLVKNQVRS